MRRPTSSTTSESNTPMNETTMHKFDSYRTLRHLRYLGLLILFASLVCQTVYAEGSRDLIRNGGNRAYLEHRTGTSGSYITAGIPRVTVIRVFANAGEVVALGSSANGVGAGAINVRGPGGFTPFACPEPSTNDTGKILNRAQEVAGANYNGVNPGGYTPCTFVALDTGIYEVDFTQPATTNSTNPPPLAVTANWSPQASADNWVTAWDVTVFDGNVAQEGRVFARYYALNLGAGSARVNLDVIVQTIDGYRYELEQDIEPFGFIFFANRKGFRDGEGNALYRSIQLNTADDSLQPGQTFNAPDQPDDIANNEVTHKIFLNEPDGSMPATAATPSGSTWLYRPDAKAPPIPQDFAFVGVDGTQDQAGTGLGGTFSFVNPLDGTDDAPAPNAYNITLEFSSGATKRVLAGTADPDVTTEVFWDGQDGDGNDVPAGQGDFIATVRLFSGEVHFPFLDVEDAPTGITIRRLNTPTGSSVTGIADPGRIYYDDSIFTNGQKELDGIITPPAAHTFTGDFGNNRAIDTWVYYPTAEPEQASIVIREADLSVAMTDDPDPILPGGPISYTFTVSNLSDGSAGTVDAVDAAITDTFPAELTNVQWRCEIMTEGTFADEPLTASSCAVNSGAGDINTTVNLKRGATATFTVTATVDQGASGAFTNTATVTRGDDASDPNESNNDASETTTVDPNPGIAGTVFDDANGNGALDSGESGLADVIVVLYDGTDCRAASTNVAGDYVFTNVADGSYQLIEAASETVPTPATCPPAEEDPAGYGSTTANTLGVNVAGSSLFAQNFGDSDDLDYGDAPASYGDAAHVVSGLFLGTAPDTDAASQPTTDADGDDTNGVDDEDGVTLDSSDLRGQVLTAGESYTLDLTTTGAGVLNAWLDFNADGDFADAGEQIASDVTPSSNTITLNITVPSNAATGTTYARFRYDSGSVEAVGIASSGEVEDYALSVTEPGTSGPPFVCDAGLYIVIGDNDPLQSQLYRVNRSVSPYGFTPVGPMTTAAAGGYPNDFRINALAYNPVDNYMYGVISRPQTTGTYAQGMIVRIDRNGEMQPIGRPVDSESSVDYSDYAPYAATFARDGTYVVGGGNRLVAIDIEQATPEVISDVTVSGASFTDFVVDPTDPDANRIYFVNESDDDVVAYADYTTGTLEGSLPNPTGTNINAGSQFADSFGTIYFRSNSDQYLYRINMDETDTANYGVAERIVQAPPGGQHDGASCAFDVAMEKTVSVVEAQPGDTVSYTYRISNPRSLPVSGLSFDDVVDSGRTFVDGTLSATETSYETGAISSYSVSPNAYGGSDTLTISNLSIPELSVVEITVDVALDTTTSGTLLNQGVLSGLEPSLGSSVNSDYPESPVYGDPTPLEVSSAEADLSLSKEVSNRTITEDENATFVEGDEVVFTLTLQNDGPGDATSIEVTDLLPSGLTFVSASSPDYDENTGVWNVGTLANGGSATLDITATVDTDAPTRMTNTAEVTAADQADPNSTPNNRNDEPSEDDTDSAALSVYQVSPNEGDIVINEVLFDQSRSGNVGAANNDEFIELYNAGNSSVDLSGWQLLDGNLIANDLDGPGGRINGTLPALPLLEPGEYAIVWIGERAASRDVPTAALQIWLEQSVRLSDNGDDVWLYDSEGRIVDYIAYGDDTAINTPPPASLGLWDSNPNAYTFLRNTDKGQSISLTPNGADSNTSACWEPTTSGDADGRCTGYLPTRDADARVVDGVERVTSIAQDNNGFEKVISGTLFYDDGLEGGTANNALQEVAEQGVSGIVITATDGANTVSTTTDGAGNYTLIIPDTFGTNITLSHSEQPVTGYNDGADATLAAGFRDADAASVTFILDESATYNFGVVRESVLRPDQNGQIAPGSTISYTHLFTPGTLGEVALSVSGTYTYQVFRDVDCDGIIQAGEQVDVLASGFTVDDTWPRTDDDALAPCALELRVSVPEGEPSGRVDLVTFTADLLYANNTDVTDSVSVTDVTTLTGGGRLELNKRVVNLTTNPNPADSDFDTVGEGKPGEVLEYCISYQNLGTETLTQTVFRDPVPFFTTFEADAYSEGQDVTNTPGDIEWTHSGATTYLSAAADSDAGALNSGVVEVTIGEVGAGEGGTVCYRVRIR